MHGTHYGNESRREVQFGASVFSSWLCWILLTWLLAAVSSDAQQAVQFFPDDVPAATANITQRLIFRASGLRQFWDDVADRAEPRKLAADVYRYSGVAVLSPENAKGGVFRITSGLNDTAEGHQHARNWLDFNSMAGAVLVASGGRLLFDNVGLGGIAAATAYKYSATKPYRNAGVGYALWPTLLLAPNATVSLRNVSVNYVDPSNIDTPEQYAAKVVFGMRQQYGSNSVTEVNSTAATVVGPLTIPVLVLNGSANQTPGEGAADYSELAYAYYENVTFNCEPWPAASTGLSGPALAAAIAVPVVVGVLLLGGLAAWGYTRRMRRQEAERRSALDKDIEAGMMQWTAEDACSKRDQQPLRDAAEDAVYVPGGTAGGTPHGSAGSSAGEGASASTEHTAASGATPAGAKTPIAMPSIQRAALQSSSAESNEAGLLQVASPGGVQGPAYGVAEPATAVASPAVAAAAAAAALQAEGLSPAPSRQLWQSTMTTSCSGSGSAAVGIQETSSYDTMGLERVSTGRVTTSEDGLARRSQHPRPISNKGSFEMAAGTDDGTAGSISATSGVEHPAVIAAVGRAGSGGRGIAGSPRSVASQRSGLGTERSGSGGTTGALGDTASGSVMGMSSSRVLDRQGGMSALLKARSELAVLRDLKIGPLLGRGSYGRVYKGRWKAVTVAVKIIEHSEGSPGTASSGANCISVGRETFVATNISHPNVVQTYHISTMTISQRNALANSWMKEAASNTSSSSAAHLAASVAARQIADKDDSMEVESSTSSESSQRSGGELPEMLETWMLLEFCEKGSLHKAIQQGKFIQKRNHEADMIGIYKALLDTASGLDYLHSIGVVHGDLKTANVLLKGSARDVRGFACKIADFGLSRVLDMDATHISTRTYGTIVYMPAELLLEGRMTTATDIYSFGLMMWELFTSQPVFEEGLSVGQIFYMIAYQAWRPITPPNCPPGYAQLMTACWHQDPEQRPTVQQLLRGLQRLYVAEKQRVTTSRQAAAAEVTARLSQAATSTAASSRPSTVGHPYAATQQLLAGQPEQVEMTAAAQPTGPAVPLAVVAPVAQQAAVSAALAAAAFNTPTTLASSTAAAVAAALGAAAGLASHRAAASEVRKEAGDRTSFESTTSDRYANAAAASEASIATTGLPQWSYPGQLTPTSPGPASAASTTAETPPMDGTPQHSSPSSPNARTAEAVTAATIAAHGDASSATAEPVAAGAAETLGGSSQGSRQSFGSSRGSANAARGSEGTARNSGDTTGAPDEYQPWAHAVSEEGLVRAGSRMLATRQRSAPLPGHWMGRHSFAAEQQHRGQGQQGAAQQQPSEPASRSQVELPPQEQQQQEESRLGALLHQALGSTLAAPAVAVGAYGPLHFTSHLPSIDDDDPIEDTIPSESLFPPATLSSSSNAVFGNPDEVAGYEYTDTSGFLATMLRTASHSHRHSHQQRAVHRPVGPAAQGFVDALDMVAGHGGGSTVPLQVGVTGSRGIMDAGTSSTPNILPPDSLGDWGSDVTTGTMPSVLGGDGSAAAGSSMALRSSGGTLGAMSTLGTQDSNWQPSSRGSLERSLLSPVFAPSAGYGDSGTPGTGLCAASPFSPSNNQATAAVNTSSTPASPFAQAIMGHAPPAASAGGAAVSSFVQAQGAGAHSNASSLLSTTASPFAQQQGAAPAVQGSSSSTSPFAQAATIPITHAAPVPQATPASTGRSPFALAAVRPIHATPIHTHSSNASSSGYGTPGTSSAGSTPEHQRTPPRDCKFLYRTPSGKVILQSRSTGTLQTVREASGSESRSSSTANSRAESGTAGSKTESAGTGGSRAASLYPAASQDYVQRHRDAQRQSSPQQQQQQGPLHQQSPRRGQRRGAGGPAPSPFAALAQRAGSLFGPG